MDAREKALDALTFARTALDDPGGLPDDVTQNLEDADQAELDQFGSVQGPSNLIRYAIDRIDDAMRLLGADDEGEGAIEWDLGVCVNGVLGSGRPFDAVEEAVEAVGEAIEVKRRLPNDVVTILVTERTVPS